MLGDLGDGRAAGKVCCSGGGRRRREFGLDTGKNIVNCACSSTCRGVLLSLDIYKLMMVFFYIFIAPLQLFLSFFLIIIYVVM
ncbi:hypothetical protein HanIR_Chr16g0843201 [Helianthus annuus]|nr:hypothetical protein HanIR_Chr16g0843201 [Helianthus annuus]